MTEPRTAAGRTLLSSLPLDEWHPVNREIVVDHILAIEAEANDPAWPAGVSDGLTLPCSDCGELPRFDYHVTEEFWRQWVPDKPARIGVVCLPCLDKRCGGVGLAKALVRVQWTGTGHTVVLDPSHRYEYEHPDHRRTCYCGHRYNVHATGGTKCLAVVDDPDPPYKTTNCSCYGWRP